MKRKVLNFITTNPKKVFEMQKELTSFQIKQINIELPEIQSIDPKEVLNFKLKQALNKCKENFFVEDTALFLEALNWKLPGPFIKYFNEYFKVKNIFELCKKFKKLKAEAIVMIAFVKAHDEVFYFTGKVKGKIVKPRGKYNFGFDAIFVPNGEKQTFAELKSKGDFALSPRSKAVNKFKKFLYNEKF